MKKVLWITLLGLFFAVGSVQAHEGKDGMGDGLKEEDMQAMVQEKLGKMSADLGLSDEQKAQVEGIMKEKMERRKPSWMKSMRPWMLFMKISKPNLKGF